jgi:putative Holliday junction resolvase
MICHDFKDFPKTGRLIGIDWGGRSIGVAASDPDRKFVFVRPPITNRESRIAIRDLIRSENVVGVVLGLPLRLDGTDSPTTKRVRKFAADLAAQTDIPIILFDESLTSFEAAENGADAGGLDSESARVLLENAIAVMGRK